MLTKKQTVTRLDSKYMQQYDAHVERQARKKKRLFRRLILFSLVFLVIFGAMTTYHIKQRSVQADKKATYVETQDKLAELKQEEDNLHEQIDLLNDEDYVLDIARTNYFFSKKGEKIFKVPNIDPTY